MTSTPAIPTAPNRRRRQKMALAGALLTFGLAAGQPAVAADPPPEPRYRQVQACDPTACLIAWGVVDSDSDGVSDADELVAGTDPHDPTSRPPMEHIAELLIARELPSFEYGLATLVALPPELLELQAKHTTTAESLLGALPLGPTRADALTRFGISAESMAAAGVDPFRTGFTLGLTLPSKEGAPGGVKVGGIDVGLISAGQGAYGGLVSPFNNGGIRTIEDFGGGRTRTTYTDGTVENVSVGDEGSSIGTITFPESQGHDVLYTQTSHTDHSDGHTTTTTHRDNFNPVTNDVVSSTVRVHDTNEAGVTTDITQTTVYDRDDNGDITGTTVMTEVTVRDADGQTVAHSTGTQKCDANGQNCTNQYVNPDAENPYDVTPEQIATGIGVLGANITTVQHWVAPKTDGDPQDPNDPGTVALIDPEMAIAALVLSPPAVTTAQPELHPDLPSPLVDAPPSGVKGGGCEGYC